MNGLARYLTAVGSGRNRISARRLVHGVAERRVGDARDRRRPQPGIEQHHDRGRAEAHGQDEQREADARAAVNTARQRSSESGTR